MPPKLTFEANPDPNYYGGKPISFNNQDKEHKKDIIHKKVDVKKVIPDFQKNNKELLDLKTHTKVDNLEPVEHSGKDELPSMKDLGEKPSEPSITDRVVKFIDNPLGMNPSKDPKKMETEARLERQGRKVVAGEDAYQEVKEQIIEKPAEAVSEGIIESGQQIKETIDKGLESISNFGNNVLLIGSAVLLIYLLKN